MNINLLTSIVSIMCGLRKYYYSLYLISMQVYYTQKSTCLHTNSQIYELRSLHIGGGLFQFPLLQIIIGLPRSVAPLTHTKIAVFPCTITYTFPFTGS